MASVTGYHSVKSDCLDLNQNPPSPSYFFMKKKPRYANGLENYVKKKYMKSCCPFFIALTKK